MRTAVPALAVIVPGVALTLGLAVIAGSATPANASAGGALCVTSGPLSGLSPDAATNARLVVSAAESLGGSRSAVVAVMTGLTESDLRVLGNPNVATPGHPTQGMGRDHDSIGIFQQRANWGTVAQRLDPVISTELFVSRLLQDQGWAAKPPWVAAQDVQNSAYDGHPRLANHDDAIYGGNYAANLDTAAAIVAAVDSDAAHHPCGALTGGVPANSALGSHGLPVGYRIPASATPVEASVVAYAIGQLDKPYVFGAAGPSAFDCSGLTMAAWASVGVRLPHNAAAQAEVGTSTTPAALVPGDLVLVPGDDGSLTAPGHVGVYLGDGLVLNAADERDGIRVQTFQNFVTVGGGLAALRHIE